MTDEILEEIKTEALKEFEQMSTVYRPGLATRAIADYLKKRVKEINPNIEVFEDEYRSNLFDPNADVNESSGNLWFDIPANDPSQKNNEPIIIQGHMDMVVSYVDDEAKKDIEQNGVMLEYHNNGTLTSLNKRTSLGADDGIGIGFILAILKSNNFKHGPIRAIFTADEEPGMIGAAHIGLTKDGKKGGPVQGFKYLINIDNLTDGEIVVSTLGSVIVQLEYPKEEKAEPIDKTKCTIYQLDVTGALGGHDGLNIEGRVSALYVLVNMLKSCISDPEFRVIEMSSPESDFHNVIQKSAHCVFASSKSFETISDEIQTTFKMFKNQFPLEEGLKVNIEPMSLPDVEIKTYSHESTAKIIKLMNRLPYGIVGWKDQESGWMESCGNMGPVFWTYDENTVNGKLVWENPSFKMKTHFRSCSDSVLDNSYEEKKKLAKEIFGSEELCKRIMIYYGWAGNTDQTLVDVARAALNKRSVKWYKCNTRSGLEVSWFKYFNKDLSMISIGPEVHNMHTVNETLYVETTLNCLGVVLECIEQMRLHKKAA